MIRLKCPNCDKSLGVDDSKAGKMAVCPTCRHKFPVPGGNPAAGKTSPRASAGQPGRRPWQDEEDDFTPYVMKHEPPPAQEQKAHYGEEDDEEYEDEDDEEEGMLGFEKEYQRAKRRRENAADLVKSPATFLRLTARIGLWGWIGMAAFSAFILAMGDETFLDNIGMEQGPYIIMVVVYLLMALVFGTFIIIGSGRLQRLEGWGFALAACIFGIVIPFFPLTVPFAIWALIVLCRKDVRSQFSGH